MTVCDCVLGLLQENDVPEEIQGICPACAEPTTISRSDGCVYVNGVIHHSCVPFGNALLENAKATQVVSMIKEKFCLSSSTDLHLLGAFLSSLTLQDKEWVGISRRAIARECKSTVDELASPATPSILEITCPACATPAGLSREGNVVPRSPDENEHTRCNVPNLFAELELALTSGAKTVTTSRQSAKKSTPISVTSSRLSTDARTSVLNAMIQHPNAQKKTIAHHASVASGLDLNRDDVGGVLDDLRLRIPSQLTTREIDALESRKTQATKKSAPTALTTPPPPQNRKRKGRGGEGERSQA